MKKLILGYYFVSSLAFAQIAPGPVTINTCCEKCKPCKTITKTVTKEVPVIVEKTVDRVVERIVEKEPKRNTLSLVAGVGTGRIAEYWRDGVYYVSPVRITLMGVRYDRDIDNTYQFGIEGLTTYDRIRDLEDPFETGTISFGFKF